MEEYVGLRSTLHAFDNRDFICGRCLSKYEGRPDGDKLTKAWRTAKGCWGGDERIRHRINKLSFSSCIGNFYDGSVVYLYDLQHRFEKGVMPFEGSLTEQPAKIIEAFGVIQAFNNERTERELKKQKEKGRRNGNR